MAMEQVALDVAGALWQSGAVVFDERHPITFKSGIVSPVYVDNRRLPFHPTQWRVIIEGFSGLIRHLPAAPAVIAGVETAGIPHSAALAYALKIPSVYVRKQPKDHGTKNRVEGGSVTDQPVILIEDMVTTGDSSLSAVNALRESGAQVTHCLAIVTYGFDETFAAFARAEVQLATLTDFTLIMQSGRAGGFITDAAADIMRAWLRDPRGWSATR